MDHSTHQKQASCVASRKSKRASSSRSRTHSTRFTPVHASSLARERNFTPPLLSIEKRTSTKALARRSLELELARRPTFLVCLDECCSGFPELTETKSCVVVLSYSSVSVSMWFSTSSLPSFVFRRYQSFFFRLFFDLPALSTQKISCPFLPAAAMSCTASIASMLFFGLPFVVCANSPQILCTRFFVNAVKHTTPVETTWLNSKHLSQNGDGGCVVHVHKFSGDHEQHAVRCEQRVQKAHSNMLKLLLYVHCSVCQSWTVELFLSLRCCLSLPL